MIKNTDYRKLHHRESSAISSLNDLELNDLQLNAISGGQQSLATPSQKEQKICTPGSSTTGYFSAGTIDD